MTYLAAAAQRIERYQRRLPEISPQGDPLLLRLLMAVVAVIFFAIDAVYQLPWFYWVGLPFYLFCLALYALGLLHSLLVQRQVSAELLIVLVMAVTLIDGKPLSGALVAWFIGFGLYVSFTIIRHNRRRIESLVRHTRSTALVLEGGEMHEVPVAAVRAGAAVIVPRGGIVPVDGRITEGASSFDESSITGEPFPVHRVAGEEIVSGTINLSAPLQIRATRDGDASFLSVISAEIRKTLEQKSAQVRRADRTVQLLLVGVSAYSFLLLLVTGSLDRMATVLSVLCPCAWALATPTAFASGIGRSARLNILVRGGEPLETLPQVRTVVLDKTGTVTQAVPRVDRVIAVSGSETELLEIAAAVESRFDNPVALAIRDHAARRGITLLRRVSRAEDLPGRGVRARVGMSEVLIGSPETLRLAGVEVPPLEHPGRAVWLAVDGQLRGAVIIQDILREAVAGLAGELRALGVERVVLATGDHEESEARRVAELIGADAWHYNCRPEDKAELVRSLRADGPVAMVGDGVNDAPALAAADVGIAVGAHRNLGLAILSSGIVILGEDARDLLRVLRIGRAMEGIIRQNYRWAMGFNGVGLVLATFGFLNPVLAAFLHHLSSVFVVANAGRLYLGVTELAPLAWLERQAPGLARTGREGARSLRSTGERVWRAVRESGQTGG